MIKAQKNLAIPMYQELYEILASGPPLAAHAHPSGTKRHSRREIFRKKFFFQFFEILKFYIFVVIPG